MGHRPACLVPHRQTMPMSEIAQSGETVVHITALRRDFVEFDFILGDPLLSVELVMHPAEFQEFCRREAATVLAAPAEAAALRASGAFDPAFIRALGARQ